MIRPGFLARGMGVLGVDIFTGPSDGYFGRYNNRDRVYSEFRYAF